MTGDKRGWDVPAPSGSGERGLSLARPAASLVCKYLYKELTNKELTESLAPASHSLRWALWRCTPAAPPPLPLPPPSLPSRSSPTAILASTLFPPLPRGAGSDGRRRKEAAWRRRWARTGRGR